MENTQLPPSTPSAPDDFGLPPGTYEYVDVKKKRNWKKILEISALVIIVAIPVALSLYRVNYSFQRVYEVINPAYIGTSPSAYQTWGGIFTAAKKLIQPVVAPTQRESAVPTQAPTIAPAQNTYPTSRPTQSTGGQGTSQPQSQKQFVYPTQPPVDQIVYPTQEIIYPTATPVPMPTATPISPLPTPTTGYVNPAVAACYGKSRNDFCSYVSSFGNTVYGKCKTSGNSLICEFQD
ncbi:hypothetical protein HY945_03600 [Candidatus Gottesmanbacteria bacterium]|nr:hypothetical protein [Candidatus Gottesmanbacteria bacterium]